MSVGSLKRLLVLINLVAVLGLCGTAYGFWSHRTGLKEQRKWPDFHFKPASAAGSGTVGQVKNTTLTLGKFPVAPTKTKTEEKGPEEVSPIESVLRNLGEIIGAVVFYAPYENSEGFKPSITFKLKEGGGVRTIALGEAIETRPHPDFGKIFPLPYRYKFVGCERDPKDLAITYFLFDMKCDGTDIQKVKWHGDIEVKPLASVARPTGVEETVAGKDMIVVSERELARRRKERAAARAAAVKSRSVEAVRPDPTEVKPIRTLRGTPDSLGDVENGTWVASDDGNRYIKNNWKKAVEDAKTTTYRNPKTQAAEGILVTGIRPGSVADKLGIYPDDVIKMINGRSVTKKSQAISIARNELEQRKRNILEVRILRNGREITKRFDARDPATRRNAKEAFSKGR